MSVSADVCVIVGGTPSRGVCCSVRGASLVYIYIRIYISLEGISFGTCVSFYLGLLLLVGEVGWGHA